MQSARKGWGQRCESRDIVVHACREIVVKMGCQKQSWTALLLVTLAIARYEAPSTIAKQSTAILHLSARQLADFCTELISDGAASSYKH